MTTKKTVGEFRREWTKRERESVEQAKKEFGALLSTYGEATIIAWFEREKVARAAIEPEELSAQREREFALAAEFDQALMDQKIENGENE